MCPRGGGGGGDTRGSGRKVMCSEVLAAQAQVGEGESCGRKGWRRALVDRGRGDVGRSGAGAGGARRAEAEGTVTDAARPPASSSSSGGKEGRQAASDCK